VDKWECQAFARLAQTSSAFGDQHGSRTIGYRYAWKLLDGIYLEYGDKASGACKKGGNLRIDYNPAKHDLAAVDGLSRFLRGHWRMTRSDVALDYFGIDLGDALFLHDSLRVTKVYRGKDGRVETVYLGSPDSAKQLRIYNKGRERRAKGGDDHGYGDNWWRLEAQYRPDGGDALPDSLFSGLRVARIAADSEELKFETVAMLEAVAADPGRLWSLSRFQRTRLKSKLEAYLKPLTPDPDSVYQSSRGNLRMEMLAYQLTAQGGEVTMHEGLPSLDSQDPPGRTA
jgi:hypothetical protein